ncbi:MAG: septum formation protein Maf [Lachnospiraceae bacterium]|jgi:septum formation protein|nr:septum formation protein Maf [Lachnospiraceae bacterium]
MDDMHIVLASASPRRKELLLQIGIRPEVKASFADEETVSDIPWEVVMELAEKKAGQVAENEAPKTIVIGSDTVVSAEGRILGKPKSHEDARQMIESLAGRTHQVYTGVCLVRRGRTEAEEKKVVFYDKTDVEVSPMTPEEIREYAFSEEPMDKAGAYAIQGFFARYIKGIQGSYANVMGLPVSRVYEELKKWRQEEERHD